MDREEKLRRHRIVCKKWYSKPENREKAKEYQKEYRQENKEKIREYGFKRRARPEYQARVKKWREEHKEYLKEHNKKWREKNKLKKKLGDREYNKKITRDPILRKKRIEKQRKFRENNKNIIKKYNQKYYTSPKGVINYTHHNHKRISTIKERPCDLSNDKVKKIFERDKVCVYCGSSERLELDHIVPLKLGGNSLFNNFVIACKKCNTTKSGKNVFKWCKIKGIEVPKIVLKLLKEQNQGIA